MATRNTSGLLPSSPALQFRQGAAAPCLNGRHEGLPLRVRAVGMGQAANVVGAGLALPRAQQATPLRVTRKDLDKTTSYAV